MKTEIINPEKLLAQMSLPVIDSRFPECCDEILRSGVIKTCPYVDEDMEECSLFNEELEPTDLGYRFERCQKCLDNFQLGKE